MVHTRNGWWRDFELTGLRTMTETVRVGAGAGYAGDRWAPAVELADARETLTRLNDPEAGYNPLLVIAIERS